jgi:hypothetical protein
LLKAFLSILLTKRGWKLRWQRLVVPADIAVVFYIAGASAVLIIVLAVFWEFGDDTTHGLRRHVRLVAYRTHLDLLRKRR